MWTASSCGYPLPPGGAGEHHRVEGNIVLGHELVQLDECCLTTINYNYLTHKKYLSRWFVPKKGGFTFQELHGDAT